jgi:Predicted flavoprotein
MKHIIAIPGSNSKQSINRQLLLHAAEVLPQHQVKVLDLNDYDIPMYSIDTEITSGIPEGIWQIAAQIKKADALIVSLAEHNGSYSAIFKSLFDWLSRTKETRGFYNKDMVLMSTSPGGRGGVGVLNTAANSFPHNDAKIISTFSLPFFGKNFSIAQGITDEDLNTQFRTALAALD